MPAHFSKLSRALKIRGQGFHTCSSLPKEVMISFHLHKSLRPSSLDSQLIARISNGVEHCWPQVAKKFADAESTVALGLINLPHKSPAFPDVHSTSKWIHDNKKVVGTLHMPGKNGEAGETWASIGNRWKKPNVCREFIPFTTITIQVPDNEELPTDEKD
ncbi:hypothetical protein NP233_g3796 [Leucocoprinus birnbaumii]|uniref:Uncharacterized protein n=1 Tax=Leucocoprinus birnbaumii TaxID=56174 RepID=A0AAD5VVW8_9AGAR|nr:hypothetical protein NP233_g3796 [Leucocoprinus birnbaumii]